MKSSPFRIHAHPFAAPVIWLGLLWVWSGALFLILLLGCASSGWPGGAAAAAVRLAVTLAVGVGLCATERWAWAGALCVAAAHAAVGLLLAAGATLSWVTAPPGAAGWMPGFWGLSLAGCARVALWGWPLTAAAGTSLYLLWRGQEACDVPARRPFGALLRFGPWLAAPALAADAYLLLSWWLANTR